MTNSTDPLDKDGGAPEPGTELAERLVRRRTDPLGMIDVRRPAQHYERTAGWVARRFSMLDHLKTRYGADESASSGESMVFTSSQRQSLAATDRAPSSPPQIARSLAQAVANKTSVARAAQSSAAQSMPVEEFRVRRRASGGAPNPGDGQGVIRRKEIPGGGEVARLSSGERSDSAPAALVKESSGFEASVTASLSTQAGTSDAAGSIEASFNRATPAPGESASGSAPTGVSRAEGDSPLPLRVRRKRGEAGVEAGALERALPPERQSSGATNLGGARIDAGSGATGSAQTPVASESILPLPLRVQRKQETGERGQDSPSAQDSPGGAAASGSLAIAAVSREPSTGEIANRASEEAAPPVGRTAPYGGESRAALPLVQRRVADSLRGSDARATGDSSGPRGPVTSAIRNGSAAAPSPAMVWRKSAAPGPREAASDVNGTTRSGELLVARQSSTGESASSSVSPGTQPAPAPSGGIDLGQIAEHVGRLLSRQLAVERERRGRGR